MLSWKEYPKTIGGLSRYLSWFKEFRRPRDIHNMSKHKDQISQVSLFGQEYDSTKKLLVENIEQGSVGDNYFLTVVAALAERGNTIPNIFHQKKYTHEGIFALKIYVKGRPEDVTVDDLFPIYNNQPAFVKPTKDGGWWLPLLEKAYAKVNINYEMISSGSQVEAARFLTGAPAKTFENSKFSTDEIWSHLEINHDSGYVITTACFIDNQGLVSGQGYIVKGLVDAGSTRLVRMKNPFKKADPTKPQWSGDWNSNSTLWTPELKKVASVDRLG